ncbi:Aste57867_710 [Aphanomyces stellatus]|uniref:Aste57867_710 protein n=1 Tax=Aphanomyces stellatus TaxID=120398 RepID=A0A485K5Z2_9STRA|nr:hypothetical protein As57867_000709 [Aphanomyces stellatus]VFT77934.1 Aste57867_710 [Aphanomyces stellatus]
MPATASTNNGGTRAEQNEAALQYTPTASSFSSEHLPGAPIIPDCVHWSADCKLACVTDESVMISTFLNKELSRYLLHPPFLTRYFLSLPQKDNAMLLPPPLEGTEDATDTPGTMTYRILNEQTRKQSSNPREISLAKGDAAMTFMSAVWGPRGSAPNSSCAIVTLTSNGHIGLHYASALDLNWKEMAVFSNALKEFVSASDWSHLQSPAGAFNADLQFAVPLPPFPHQQRSKLSDETKRRRLTESATFVQTSDLLSVTSVAWSVACATDTETHSLLAFCGRRITTVWRYVHGGAVIRPLEHVAAAHTGPYGWPTCSAWMHMETSALAVGTSMGNVVLLALKATELSIERVIRTPHLQPVYSVQYTLHDIAVAAGNHIAVWQTADGATEAARTWVAHESNVTALELNHFDDTLFSASTDGCVKCWNKASGALIPLDYLPKHNYPIFGLSLSPNSVQLACGYVCPPAAKPSRITQADTTYARLSSGLECFAAPNARSAQLLAASVESQSSLDSLGDILSYCHAENAAFLTKQSEMRVLHVTAPTVHSAPLFSDFCSILEAKYTELNSQTQWSLPLFLQVAYQVWTNMPVSDDGGARTRLRQLIMCYWCETTLESNADPTSLLLMADFLWLIGSTKCPMTTLSSNLVKTVYKKHGTNADMERFKSGQGTLPVRETCGMCTAEVPITKTVMEPVCGNGHALERCFVTLRIIDSATVVWKCMVCEAFAHFNDEDVEMVCRLCGSFCQKIEY